jgi:16S rRNA (adenine1518-N6/adenine1519-N6)-dimethyltransferase
MTKEELRKILKSLGVHPSKKLGQSFLVNDFYDCSIVDAAKIELKDTIIEIGSGIGNLTKILLDSGYRVIAVELDRRFCEYLKKKFGGYENFNLICDDILNLNINDLKNEFLGDGQKFTVLGNIPYSLSTPIIKHFISYKEICKKIYLLLQKEVWERLSGNPRSKDYGFFTILTSMNFTTSRMLEIKRQNFYPIPKVDSTLVRFEPIDLLKCKDKELLIKILSAAFSQRRKMMKNTLSKVSGLCLKEDDIVGILNSEGISEKARPEELSLDQFIRFSDTISDQLKSVRLN